MLKRQRYQRRCRHLAQSCTNGILKTYLLAAAEAWPDRLDNSPLIAVDLELTGLDADQHAIIALGWVLIDNGRVRLGSGRQWLVNSGQSVGPSATIHELTDRELAGGVTAAQALQELFSAARGRCWVFHHARLDKGFLQRACLDWAACAPPLPVLDTLQIEQQRRRRRDQVIANGGLTLSALRAEYGLPGYRRHDALADALGAAELLLAIGRHLEPNGSPQLPGLVQVL